MYPLRYEADYAEEQDRLKTFFRLILVIPWAILANVYLTAAFIVSFLAWFAILFTGRYPEGLYNFNAGVMRNVGRVFGFSSLQTDQWPSFGFEDDIGYPVRVEVDPPLPKYNRWKTFFRLILAFPVYFMYYLMSTISGTASIVAWFHIVFMGRTSGGIHNALTVGIAWQMRALAYFLLATETIPPVSDQAPAANIEPGAGAATSIGAPQSEPAA